MKKFEQFQNKFDDAMANIQKNLNDSKLGSLFAWMLETDMNPYQYLPSYLASCANSAEGFSSLIDTIRHAFYDDGECHVATVDGEPRLVFVDIFCENGKDMVLTDQEKELNKMKTKNGRPYIIDFPNVSITDFPQLARESHRNQIKRWFTMDARRDIESAVKHYRNYDLWDENWYIEEKQKQELKRA